LISPGDFTISWCNTYAIQLFGKQTQEDFIERPVNELFDEPLDDTTKADIYKSLTENRVFKSVYDFKSGNSQNFQGLFQANQVMSGDMTYYVIKVVSLEDFADNNSQEKKYYSHSIKNNLSELLSYIYLQIQDLKSDDKDQALKTLVETSYRIKAMAVLHELLAYEASGDVVNLKDYISSLVKNLDGIAKAPDIDFQLDLDITMAPMNVGKAIGMIINEMVVNSYKHAFDPNQKKSICITLKLEKETECLLQYSDNGKKARPQAPEYNLGSKIIDAMVDQIAGTYDFVIDSNGFNAVLKFSLG